ncbi:Bifunctional dTDP-4-dehydrorhamnose 3,5-epimerase/dTDP-4-dehydrorhamnose reductase [Spatholobus suberectus]|nr:Bifunctional dTDP-4-dehydrorhamnose 3,5-epimerase/dTDP-4-dehydrorhamnose reductase [Spatholobus suberectus]
MYRDYIDPNFKWVNFTLEEQAKVIVAPRSNNEMDASKLKKEFPELLSIKESLIKYVFEPTRNRQLHQLVEDVLLSTKLVMGNFCTVQGLCSFIAHLE